MPVQGIKDTIGSGAYNVNELLAVLRLLRYVCSHKDAELARLVKRAHARGQVMVPDTGCCLVATSACVHTHGCPPQLLARSPFLFSLKGLCSSELCVHAQEYIICRFADWLSFFIQTKKLVFQAAQLFPAVT